MRTILYPYRAIARDEHDDRYLYDKIPVERAVMGDAELPGTVLRLPAIYGPGDRQHRLYEYLKRMGDASPLRPPRTGRGAVVLDARLCRECH